MFLRAEVGALEADLVVDRDLWGRKKQELLARDNASNLTTEGQRKGESSRERPGLESPFLYLVGNPEEEPGDEPMQGEPNEN